MSEVTENTIPLDELIECVQREDNVVDVNPFITVIRNLYGPIVSARVFKEWRVSNGI